MTFSGWKALQRKLMFSTSCQECGRHQLSGVFLWIGGFRSSELLKLLVNQLEPLTEQQLVGIYNLQQSSQQAEDALSQGMEALQQSLADTLANGSPSPAGSSGNVANYMGQMAMAMGKLGTLEGFLRQADNLRQQTLQQMHRILTTRQSARALLAINDYFSRLRALSSLWLARPREWEAQKSPWWSYYADWPPNPIKLSPSFELLQDQPYDSPLSGTAAVLWLEIPFWETPPVVQWGHICCWYSLHLKF